MPEEALKIAAKYDFEIKGYSIGAHKEQLRPPRIVRVGAVQNSIKAPTTAPVAEQVQAIH